MCNDEKEYLDECYKILVSICDAIGVDEVMYDFEEHPKLQKDIAIVLSQHGIHIKLEEEG
jgi:hypothetical protein